MTEWPGLCVLKISIFLRSKSLHLCLPEKMASQIVAAIVHFTMLNTQGAKRWDLD